MLRHFSAGAVIPVTGIAQVAFLAVQVSMNPTAIGIVNFLGYFMGLLPISFGIVP
jgi:hypothetical protein